MNKGSSGFFFLVRFGVLLGLVSGCLRAQENPVVKDLAVHGLTVFTQDEIIASFSTKIGQPFVASAFQRDLDGMKERYHARGYYDARVDSCSTKTLNEGLDIGVYVDEGKMSAIDTVFFEGDSAIPAERLMRATGLRPGMPFIQQEVESGAQAILRTYEAEGYPLASVSVDSVSMTHTKTECLVRFTYAIVEGSQVKISELRVEGNTTTRASVIIREARLRSGEFYSDRLAELVKRRLDRMQLFSSVSLPELFLDEKNEGGLLVKVQEGNPNRFDGIVGYVPSPQPGVRGYLTGLIDLQFRNLFGTGRRLAARWSREDRYTQELGIQYFEPWIASYPINGQIGFTQRIQDSTYVRRQTNLNLEFAYSDQLSFGGVFSQYNVIPSESYGKSVMAENSALSIGLTLTYDTRNDPMTPTAGFYYKTEYDLGTKDVNATSFSPASSNSTQRVLMDFNYYIEPFFSQVVAVGVHIQDFRSSVTELGDLFRLGGASTLRGYREGQFLGSRIAWSNLEYRFMVAQRSYFYGFLDAGYIVTPNEPLVGLQASEQTRLGYGVGVRMDTNLGLIGVGIGFGEGDTFSTAKLHIQLINAF